MGRRFVLSLALLLCAEAALAQVATTSGTSTSTINTSLPVAYVYVSSKHYIHAYKAWADGKITSITGSPFAFAGILKMSVTKKFLFGDDGSNATTFAIASNGSLTKAGTTAVWKYGMNNCGSVNTQVDRSSTTFYHAICAFNQAWSSFHIGSNGSLQFLGNSGGNFNNTNQGGSLVLAMLGNNKFAYDSYCDEDYDRPVVDIYKRQTDGSLLYTGQENGSPQPAPGTALCAGTLAVDSSNHLAIAFQRIDSQPHDSGYIYGPYFIASYTADSNGNITTTSTYKNMPSPAVAQTSDVHAMSISPDGKYVAVGAMGFQVLHFNGSNPVTNFSRSFLTGQYVQKFGWDKAHHLYVLSAVYGSGTYTTYLHIYNVTSTGVKEVSGSPHYLANLTNLIILDLQ